MADLRGSRSFLKPLMCAIAPLGAIMSSQAALTPLARGVFFAHVRASLFSPGLTEPQVEGCTAILDEAERRSFSNIDQLAYILATPWWETKQTMQPIPEDGRGRGREYGRTDPQTGQVYYGRGLVQITWKANYSKFASVVGADLLHHPDLALQMPIAVKILFEGMTRGLFTGKKLSDFIHVGKTDFYSARRIINKIDKARTIADAAVKFQAALRAANEAPSSTLTS